MFVCSATGGSGGSGTGGSATAGSGTGGAGGSGTTQVRMNSIQLKGCLCTYISCGCVCQVLQFAAQWYAAWPFAICLALHAEVTGSGCVLSCDMASAQAAGLSHLHAYAAWHLYKHVWLGVTNIIMYLLPRPFSGRKWRHWYWWHRNRRDRFVECDKSQIRLHIPMLQVE